ncbi:MAG: PQQ-dependent sugar dehydrogenase, partial [Vicinamibacterales bacterium]
MGFARRWSRVCQATLAAICLAVAMPLALEYQGVRPASATGAAAKPDESRFTPVVLVPPGELDEPMAFDIAKNGKVYLVERKGALKVFDPATKTTSLVAEIPVNTKYTNAAGVQREAEEGLVGVTLDPNFEKTNWIYMLYAEPAVTKHVLARWEIKDGVLDEESKKVLLEYSTQREQCCHTGGGMAWDARGNLYITVGNNTSNSIGSQTDERPGRSSWDDQRGAANTNDLRGKILRIHPEPDGTYTIPEGNLFAPGTPGTRPEIYTMGHRNAWRVSVDSKTGYIYWGEVGPDANEDSELGPRGYDELNQAKGPGFFGWPYFIADNRAYPYFDYVKDVALAPKDAAKPTNTSVNNTGLRELPPAQPAFIYYPYGPSEKFPEVGSGGRSATGGPIFRRADFPNAARPFPDYYEGKWLAADLSRGWIMAISIDEQGNYQSMERFVPAYRPSEIIDLKFGPDGDLYVLDYGSTWFAKSADSQLVRIEYNGGNRVPAISVSADRTGGIAPFKVAFSSAGTKDPDGDPLTYEWIVESAAGGEPRVFKQANPTIPFERNGIYSATLTVTDSSGGKNTDTIDIIAGNTPPAVALDVKAANRTFFTPGAPIGYAVRVSDREDGAAAAAQVAFSIDYVPEGFDVSKLEHGQATADPSTRFAVAKALIAGSDCATCHNREAKSRGPSFTQLAEKYKSDAETLTYLAGKVRGGSTGVWGQEVMPAHPLVSVHEAKTIAEYMLNVNDTRLSALPLQGTYTPTIPEGDNGRGSVVVRAVYSDKGAGEYPALTSEAMTILRSPKLGPQSADIQQGITAAPARGAAGAILPKNSSHIGFTRVDLTGIRSIELLAQAQARGGHAGGTIEIRTGSPTGPIIGRHELSLGGAQGPTATQIQEKGGAAPAAGQGRGGGRGGRGSGGGVIVPIKPAAGVQDLYFVFRNDKALAVQP